LAAIVEEHGVEEELHGETAYSVDV